MLYKNYGRIGFIISLAIFPVYVVKDIIGLKYFFVLALGCLMLLSTLCPKRIGATIQASLTYLVAVLSISSNPVDVTGFIALLVAFWLAVYYRVIIFKPIYLFLYIVNIGAIVIAVLFISRVSFIEIVNQGISVFGVLTIMYMIIIAFHEDYMKRVEEKNKQIKRIVDDIENVLDRIEDRL